MCDLCADAFHQGYLDGISHSTEVTRMSEHILYRDSPDIRIHLCKRSPVCKSTLHWGSSDDNMFYTGSPEGRAFCADVPQMAKHILEGLPGL